MDTRTFVPSRRAHELSAHFALALRDSRHSGHAGERLGSGTGASLEFQDRRNYVAGDDIRHLDWAAYARSDQLMVRLYREEILPQVDLVLDTSRSLAVYPEKAQCALDIAWLVSEAGRRGGYHVRLIDCADEPRILSREELEQTGVDFSGRVDLVHGLHASAPLLRPGSVRILVSDFLAPASAADIVRPVRARAAGCDFVQVLAQEDVAPPLGGALRLEDAETDEVVDVVLDDATLQLYADRLARLRGELVEEARRSLGRVHSVVVADLEQVCREDLLRSGLLTPA